MTESKFKWKPTAHLTRMEMIDLVRLLESKTAKRWFIRRHPNNAKGEIVLLRVMVDTLKEDLARETKLPVAEIEKIVERQL